MSAILCRQATSKRGCQRILWFSLKLQNASKKKAKTEKGAGHWRKSADLSIGRVGSILIRTAKKFRKGNAVAVWRQVNCPDIVQRDIGEKRVRAKR